MISRKELCVLYNCGEDLIRKWLREAGITHRRKILDIEFEQFKKVVGEPTVKQQPRR